MVSTDPREAAIAPLQGVEGVVSPCRLPLRESMETDSSLWQLVVEFSMRLMTRMRACHTQTHTHIRIHKHTW